MIPLMKSEDSVKNRLDNQVDFEQLRVDFEEKTCGRIDCSYHSKQAYHSLSKPSPPLKLDLSTYEQANSQAKSLMDAVAWLKSSQSGQELIVRAQFLTYQQWSEVGDDLKDECSHYFSHMACNPGLYSGPNLDRRVELFTIDITGDGNCFFRSMAVFVYGC